MDALSQVLTSRDFVWVCMDGLGHPQCVDMVKIEGKQVDNYMVHCAVNLTEVNAFRILTANVFRSSRS